MSTQLIVSDDGLALIPDVILTRVLDGILYTPKEDDFYSDTTTMYYVFATWGDQSWSSFGYDNTARNIGDLDRWNKWVLNIDRSRFWNEN